MAAGVFAVDDQFRFHVYPNPFTAGFTAARLAYFLPAPATVSAFVYDAEGRLVREVVAGVQRGRGFYNGVDVWDGRDAGGEWVAPGPYVMLLEVRTRGEIFRRTFVVVVRR